LNLQEHGNYIKALVILLPTPFSLPGNGSIIFLDDNGTIEIRKA
jgi:hypothetical protein